MCLSLVTNTTEKQPRSDAGGNWEPEMALCRAFTGEEKKGSQLLLTRNALNRLKIMKQHSHMSTPCSQLSNPLKGGLRKPLKSRGKEVNKLLWNPGRSLVRWLRSCCHSLMSLPEFSGTFQGARGCRSWASQPLVQMVIPSHRPGTLCRTFDFAGESLSTQNVCRAASRSQDPRGFNLSGWSFCYKPRRTHSKNGCLVPG